MYLFVYNTIKWPYQPKHSPSYYFDWCQNYNEPHSCRHCSPGSMSTLSLPVFYRHQFIGVVAMDISVDNYRNSAKDRFVMSLFNEGLISRVV